MGFNFNSQPEYSLNQSMTEEMIDLYGVLLKYVKTTKVNEDISVFGDFSHMKPDGSDIIELHGLPENSDDWDSSGPLLTSFGLIDTHNISLFVAASIFPDYKSIVGNLFIFPNGKIMEISDIDFIVPGVNNLFTYADQKTVLRVVCVPYEQKHVDEVDTVYQEADPEYVGLEQYFDELAQAIDDEVVTPAEVGEKPIVDKSEDDVWGSF